MIWKLLATAQTIGEDAAARALALASRLDRPGYPLAARALDRCAGWLRVAAGNRLGRRWDRPEDRTGPRPRGGET